MAHYDILLGLAKICAGTLFVYLFLKILVFFHGQNFQYLFTAMGAWYLVEVLGFVALPCVLFTMSVRKRNFTLIKVSAIMTMIGIVLNRLNISLIAFNWTSATRYYPTWMEIVVTMMIIALEIQVFRWIVNRMPILREPPEWAREKEGAAETIESPKLNEEEKKWNISAT
jgi:Ni/Fe-hydrogenase subunit HybB-like protein